MRTHFLALASLALMAAGCRDSGEPRPPSVKELTAMLQSDDAKVQVEAAHWVIHEGPKAAATTPALIMAMKSPDQMVRQSAALALGHVGPEAVNAVPALIAGLDDPENSVRQAAAQSLGALGPAASAAVPALEKLAAQPDKCSAAPAALKKIRP